MNPLLNPNIVFIHEDEDVSLRRYTCFAADFFPRLYSTYPTLLGGFEFFRDLRSDDVWSICRNGSLQFGVQLDPDIQVICIWDSGWHQEIGTWEADPVAFAINLIGDRYL